MMRALLHRAGVVFTLLALAACGNEMKIEEFANTEPKLIPEEYFLGPMKAWGLFQDRSGAVKRQFVVDLNGEWDGETLTLTEDFAYDDGQTERRVWRLTKTGENTYTGSADSVVGPARVVVAGNAMNLAYTFALEVGGRTYHVDFDDWMFLQPDGERMINRATVTKFGLRVGEVTVFFDKSEGAIAAGQTAEVPLAAE
ncbi:MAG: DUF3833 domain-containing protein [Alphaproteobacteria bacterium]|nr:DUF3833 domain-containing protein [Alphaproteobacteria bacterium SS10]